jgi:hypothetical protein
VPTFTCRVYDKQREDCKVDELMAQLSAFRHLDDNSDDAKRQIEKPVAVRHGAVAAEKCLLQGRL